MIFATLVNQAMHVNIMRIEDIVSLPVLDKPAKLGIVPNSFVIARSGATRQSLRIN